jgi:hypothetical protein
MKLWHVGGVPVFIGVRRDENYSFALACFASTDQVPHRPTCNCLFSDSGLLVVMRNPPDRVVPGDQRGQKGTIWIEEQR